MKSEIPGAKIDTDEADYGFHQLISVRLFNSGAIKRIIGAVACADVVITHSNGFNYLMKALKFLNRPNLKIIALSPAYNDYFKFNRIFKKCSVFHTQNDNILWWSKLLILHPWGKMGKIGAIQSERVFNVDCTKFINGHSDWFNANNLKKVSRLIAERLL
ncbi:MAG: hypothetical protein L3J83_03690 [Proteobacteria bacterium]|nr:hypothetical protein [Pseudomonadota bacterium]